MADSLSRRNFLRVAGATGAAAWSRNAVGSAAGAERPNLLWLSVEDISPHLGCYGCEDAITPTLDALAQKGVRFDNAFAAAPVCAPNRSSTISGVYASALGSHHMRSGGEGDDRSNKPKLAGEVAPFPILLREAGYYCTNNTKEDYNFETDRQLWHESSARAHWRNRPRPDQPFFAVFNCVTTHEGRVRADDDQLARLTRDLTDSQRRDPASVATPPYHADTAETRRGWANYHELITAMDYWAADLLAQLEKDGLAETTIVVFWSDHGHGLPRGKRWLYDSGTRIPMIAYVPEAWRDHAGLEMGRPDDRFVNCVDLAPSMLNLAGIPVPEYMQGRPFMGPDQPAPEPYVYAFRDRMDERYDMIRMVRDTRYKYLRNYRPDLPYNQHLHYAQQSPVKQDLDRLAAAGTLRPEAWWVTARTKSVEELYDLSADPDEVHNIAEDPENAPVLERMRTAHRAWMQDIRDLGLIPEPELVRLEARYGARYRIYTALDGEYPEFWTELRRTADGAARLNHDDRDLLAASLESIHPSIRFWAVIGLRRDTRADGFLRLALQDQSPMVAVAAAHGLMDRADTDTTALEVLVEALHGPDEWVRLLAAQALDNAGENARPAVPALQAALEDRENKYVVRVADHALSGLLGPEQDAPAMQ